ncbi:hypothetical protein H5410_037001 [Solanum commersonii]|uniref:Uncharacterized protein n=1 Tax=Solanum commersonii TaxID=4109 RepID=A0A9J5Y5X0_SOLCO|nr:hypothetical protein H5410_037001 [Solanum commersonii]
MRITEPIRRVTKRSYPRLLFQCAEPGRKGSISGEQKQPSYHRAVSLSSTMSPNEPNTMMLKDRARWR